MPRLVQHANAAVHDCRLAPEYRGKSMATTLVAWHEKYGAQEQQITVAPKESKAVNFTFKG